jgi:hypothetical protein
MAVSENPDFFKSLAPRQKHAGVTGWELSYNKWESMFIENFLDPCLRGSDENY